MPRRLTHVVTGAGAGMLTALIKSQGQPEPARILEVFGGFGGGCVGGRLPDILDPAFRNPRHRGRAHSILVGATGVKLWQDDLDGLQARCRAWADYCKDKSNAAAAGSIEAILFHLAEMVCRVMAGFIAGLIAGYLSHLFLDAHTERCLTFV